MRGSAIPALRLCLAMTAALCAAIPGATFAQTPAASAAPSPAAITAPAGVTVPVVLTEQVSSQDAKVGQRFGFETAQAVTFGNLQIPAKTPGHGTVTAVSAAQGKTLGTLTLSVDSLDLPDGKTVAVHPKAWPVLHRAQGKAVPVPIPLVGFILFGAVVKPNYNVLFQKGSTFQVETDAPAASP